MMERRKRWKVRYDQLAFSRKITIAAMRILTRNRRREEGEQCERLSGGVIIFVRSLCKTNNGD